MIKVSIIVPIYNSEEYLNKCIDSLVSQTESNIEILLLNDGSTDNCDKIIKKYNDKRIKYVSKENEGIGKTRNLGIEHSSGKYIMFIDSDDYIAKDCVEKMYNYAESTNSDLVISDFYKNINGQLEKFDIPYFESSSLTNNPQILNMVNMGPCNKLYKKDLLKNIKFDENLKYEDVYFVCKVLYKAKKISKLNEYLSYYVINSNSEITIRDKSIFDIIKVNKKLKDLFYHNKKLKESFIDLSVMMITDYAAQTMYIKDRKVRKQFIYESYEYLDGIDTKWRKRDRFKKISFIKRLVKANRKLLLLYVDIVGIFYRL